MMFTADDRKWSAVIILIIACWLVLPIVLIECFGDYRFTTSALLGLLAFVLLALGAFGCLHLTMVNQFLSYEETGDIELLVTLLLTVFWPATLLLILAFEGQRPFFDPPSQ